MNKPNKQVKKSRAWSSKAKSGCVTCKARRVKCDEDRPSCLQCSRVGRVCEGYEGVGKKSARVSNVLRPPILLPKDAPKSQTLIYPPTASMFKSNEEDFCFQHFCKNTSTFLSGPFESDLWSRFIPQACVVNTSIRHAVIAVAALSLIRRDGRDFVKNEAEVYHQFALRQYSKALLQMRTATLDRSHDLRTALLASLIIICFETFYGNQESALAQLGVGLALINAWFKEKNDFDLCSTESWLSVYNLEEGLIQVYARLDVSVMMLMRSKPSECRITMTKEVLKVENEALLCFQSLEEARIHLVATQRRLLNFFDSNAADELSHWQHSADTLTDFPSCYLKERENLLDRLLQWYIAFDPILQQVRGARDNKRFYGALVLHLHYLTTYYTIVSLPSETPVRGRDLKPPFAEIISLSRTILQHQGMVCNTFTFDAQTVKPLYTVACQCPSLALRHQAISLLLSAPRREGFWDSVLCGKIAQWIVGIEEEDSKDDHIPDETKIQSLTVKADLQKRVAHVQCLRPENKMPQRVISRRAVITW